MKMSVNDDTGERALLELGTVCDALAATPGADEWQVEALVTHERQAYRIGEREEARRAVKTELARVEVHNNHEPHDSEGLGLARGTATLRLLPGDIADGERLRARLRDAVTIASQTDSPPYPLPSMPDDSFPEVETSDPLLTGDVSAALEDALARLQTAVHSWSSVRLSSAELYAGRRSRLLRNSRGLAGISRGTSIFLDFVLIAQEGQREAEFHAELQRNRLADLMIESTVDAYATFARHSVYATAPGQHTGPVILSGEALSSFFTPVIFNTSAQALYQKLSRLKQGEHLVGEEPRGDRITLISDARRPFGTRTAPFDREGLPARTIPVVVDGVFERPWADTRYATYLGVPATGAFANLTIPVGAWPLDALRSAVDGPVYEIVSFSWMSPDPITGDFSSEIKLGYRHDAQGTAPIKGGALSGNVFSALTDARLSTEAYSDGTYSGPSAIRFGTLAIAGEA